MGAVSAMESGGHEGHGSSDCATRPCKNRKDGAPTFQTGKRNQGEGWATRRLKTLLETGKTFRPH
jgi:hypothetical protein